MKARGREEEEKGQEDRKFEKRFRLEGEEEEEGEGCIDED